MRIHGEKPLEVLICLHGVYLVILLRHTSDFLEAFHVLCFSHVAGTIEVQRRGHALLRDAGQSQNSTCPPDHTVSRFSSHVLLVLLKLLQEVFRRILGQGLRVQTRRLVPAFRGEDTASQKHKPSFLILHLAPSTISEGFACLQLVIPTATSSTGPLCWKPFLRLPRAHLARSANDSSRLLAGSEARVPLQASVAPSLNRVYAIRWNYRRVRRPRLTCCFEDSPV